MNFQNLMDTKIIWFLKNFNNSNSNQPLIKKFIDDVNLEIQYQYKNSNDMIVHYLDNYKYIPLWV